MALVEILIALLITTISGVAFVLSSGHLFKDKFKDNRVLVFIIVIISIVSTISLYDPVTKAVGHASAYWRERPRPSKPLQPKAVVGSGQAAGTADGAPDQAASNTLPSVSQLDDPAVVKAMAKLEEGSKVYVSPSIGSVQEIEAKITAHPNDADLWHDLAQALWRDRRFDEAIKAFETAAHSPPRYIGRGFLYRDLAEALEARGRIDEALAAARKMMVGWPVKKYGLNCHSSETQLLVRLLLKARQYSDASQIYKTISSSEPQNSECRQISDALAKLG